MKSIQIYSLVIFLCAQPAFAQFESDEQWQQQAAKQIQMQNANRAKQPAKKLNPQIQQAVKRPMMGGYPSPMSHSSPGGGYGYRPSRGSVRTGYGYRPQRAQLMPQGYSQEMLQQKIMRLQQMQQMMGGGAPGQPQPQQPQQKPNFLQMLMGGGAQPAPQQQQQSGQPQFNRAELMKSFFGGGEGSNSEQSGE